MRSAPPPSDPDREALAEAQRRLLATLVEGAPPPPGFDPGELARTAAQLRVKRKNSAKRASRRGRGAGALRSPPRA